MGILRIEKGKGMEANEVFLNAGELRLQEIFAVTADLPGRNSEG